MSGKGLSESAINLNNNQTILRIKKVYLGLNSTTFKREYEKSKKSIEI